jgi:hypothetical protein
VPFSEAQVTSFSVSFGENRRLELNFQSREIADPRDMNVKDDLRRKRTPCNSDNLLLGHKCNNAAARLLSRNSPRRFYNHVRKN